MIVCIAEKPSVAKDIAKVLGANQSFVSRGVGYYEGNGYRVTWTFGHLCMLKEPRDYNPFWGRWDLKLLPMIPNKFEIKAIDIPNYIAQLDIIKNIVTDAEYIVNCGDAGQEGELIQRWVLDYVHCKVPVKRLWISSLTEEAIKEGFNNLKDSKNYESLYHAGMSRAIGDWIIGMNATRLYTMKQSSTEKILLSIGRVQTPTLALVVERDREIESFIPKPYWELKTKYRDTIFSAVKGKFDDKEKGEKSLDSILNKELEITDLKKKKGKDQAPKLFDLTSLQVVCNRKFGMTADETLKTIQSLYEKKLTSYPRVDTTYLSEDIYPKVAGILQNMKAYASLTAPILSANGGILKRKSVFDNSKVTDHHAIIPTGVQSQYMTENEAKVYDLIARHFIAIFYPDSEFSTTTVEAKVDKVKFKVTGKEILTQGWRDVFGKGDEDIDDSDDERNNDDKNSILPNFIVGERGEHSPQLIEKQTKAPKRYTEASLLRAMETAGKTVDDETLRDLLKENGIGRPSTRSNIIETLFKRKYIERNAKTIISTDTARELIDSIDFEELKSASLTGQWEGKLRAIERKELGAASFIKDLSNMIYELVAVVRDNKEPNIKVFVECPICKSGQILRGNRAWGCSNFRRNCKFIVPFDIIASDTKPQLLKKEINDYYQSIINTSKTKLENDIPAVAEEQSIF